MTDTAAITLGRQRMRALERANQVRLARARLKRQIASGQLAAASVILELPTAAASWSVGELLASQRRWGTTRARKLLDELHISETRPIGELTERQRRLLASHLGIPAPRTPRTLPARPVPQPAPDHAAAPELAEDATPLALAGV